MYCKVFLRISFNLVKNVFFALVPGIQSRPFDSNLIDRCSCAPINLKSHTTRCLWSPDQFSCSAWCPNQITHFSHSAVGPCAKVNISQIAKCGSIKSLVKCKIWWKAGTIKLELYSSTSRQPSLWSCVTVFFIRVGIFWRSSVAYFIECHLKFERSQLTRTNVIF